MTTFEQWRSPSNRPPGVRVGRKPSKYDLRLVDQFYAYCRAVSRTDAHREDSARSQRATKRSLLTILVTGAFLFYYLVERVAQAMSGL
jgi:hypothetical protein